MTTFPKTILNPSTPHSLPCSLGLELVRKLRARDINAFGFLIEDERVERLKKEGFINNPDIALADLKAQLPADVHEEFFPTPPAPMKARSKPRKKQDDDDDDDDGGGMMGMGISMPPPGSNRRGVRW